jgi:hypothetical protein
MGALMALLLPAQPTPTYTIVSHMGYVRVRVKTQGLVNPSKGLLLDARKYRGRILVDPMHLDGAHVELRIPYGELIPIAPRMTELERADVVDWLRSTWGLWAPGARDIAFVSSGANLRGLGPGGIVSVEMPGRLEIRKSGRPETVAAQVRVDKDGITAWGRHTVRQRDYGLIPYRDRSGAYSVKNELEIEFRVFAKPEALGPPR